MPDKGRSLLQQVQEQIVQSAQDFHGESLGRLKSQLRGDRAQLEELAEQLLEGDARARIQDMIDSYSEIEGSLDRVAHGLGSKAVQQVQETGEQAAQGTRGVVGQATKQVEQVAESAQGVAGQVMDQVGRVAENLPDGQLLSQTTNEAGQTVQRVVDESGDVFEITLDEASNLVDERLVESHTDLPAEEECRNEEGRTIEE